MAWGKFVLDQLGKAIQRIEQKNKPDPGRADKISQYTATPTIVNGLQNHGSNTSFIKGLFN